MLEDGIDFTLPCYDNAKLCVLLYVLIPVVNVARLCQVVLFLYTRLHEVMVQHERCILIELHIQHQYEQMDVLPRSPVNL
jgi:hypothetical protein